MSAMYAGIAFTVVFSIPALVREIRLARRSVHPPVVRGHGSQSKILAAIPFRRQPHSRRCGTAHIGP
jgi:hypothetical protein